LDKRLAADGRGLQQVHINENFAKLAEALYIADRKVRMAVSLVYELCRQSDNNMPDTYRTELA
jgi:SNW domain-containing protein 1